MSVGYLYLSLAILAEVLATLALRSAKGFTSLGPSVLVVLGYATAFFMLGLTLRTISVGIAYAIWSGIGTAAVALAAAVLFSERLTALTGVGIALIVAGVVVVQLGADSKV